MKRELVIEKMVATGKCCCAGCADYILFVVLSEIEEAVKPLREGCGCLRTKHNEYHEELLCAIHATLSKIDELRKDSK